MNTAITILIFLIFLGGIFFSIYLKMPQFKAFKALKSIKGTPSYHAFLVTLATNIGTGNLVGVSSGIVVGGPGVIIWMWIFGFFSCSLSYLENYYAVKYQTTIENEKRGGACYYILKGLNCKTLSIIFAVFLLLTNTLFFPPLQVNTVVTAISSYFEISKILVGIVLFLLIVIVAFRGTKTIVKVTELFVPYMTIGFVLLTIILMCVNIKALPIAVTKIFNSAFNIKSFGVGYIINSISTGFRRSLFSNEAGLGTTPSITGMSDGCPETQGYLQIIGVYVDTLLMCTLTGIFIVQMNINTGGVISSDMIIKVFDAGMGKIGAYFGFLFLSVFAFASVVGQFYLGESNALFFSEVTNIKPRTIVFLYKIIYAVGIIVGIITSTEAAISLLDIGMILLGTINLIAIIILEKKRKHLAKIID